MNLGMSKILFKHSLSSLKNIVSDFSDVIIPIYPIVIVAIKVEISDRF